MLSEPYPRWASSTASKTVREGRGAGCQRGPVATYRQRSSTRVSGEMSLRLGTFELTRRGRPQRPPLFLFIFPFATCVGGAEAGQVMGGLVIYNPSGLRVMGMV